MHIPILYLKTRVRQNVIQTRCDPAMKSCSRSTVYVTVSGQELVDMFPRNCTNTWLWLWQWASCKYDIIQRFYKHIYLQWLRYRKTNSNVGVKQSKNLSSSRIQFLEVDLKNLYSSFVINTFCNKILKLKKFAVALWWGRPFGFYMRLLWEETSLQLAQMMNTIGEHKCQQKDVNN